MDSNRPKENENPIIHDVVDNTDSNHQQDWLGYSEIQALNQAAATTNNRPLYYCPYNNNKDSSGSVVVVVDSETWVNQMMKDHSRTTYDDYSMSSNHKTTMDDVAILRALTDASNATNGEGVSILKHSGVSIPSDSSQNNHSNFIPSNITSLLLQHDDDDATYVTKGTTTTTASTSRDGMDANEIFEIIRTIQDPEHPTLTLEQLGVVKKDQIDVHTNDHNNNATESSTSSNQLPTIDVRFTPTVPHCSMATLIGLCIRVKLHRSLPPSNNNAFKVKVRIQPGTHASENAVNKQLADKERVCAALENKHLLNVVNKCIAGTNNQ